MGRAHRTTGYEIGVVGVTLLAAMAFGCAVAVLLASRPGVRRLERILISSDQGLPPSPRAHSAADGPSGLASAKARLAASAVAGVGGATAVDGPGALVAAVAVSIAAWLLLRRIATRTRAGGSLVVTALAADLLLAAVRSGCSPVVAAATVGSAIGGGLGRALAADSMAARMGAGDQGWQSLRANPQWRPLGRALATSLSHGTSPAPALERAARDARATARWDGEARARSVGARAAAPLGLCFLPAFVLVAIVPIVVTSFT